MGFSAEEFSGDDLDLVLRGLEALEKQSGQISLLKMLTGTMLSRTKEEAEKFLKRQEHEDSREKIEQRRLKDEIAVLRGKLIVCRKAMESKVAEKVFDEATTPE